MSIEEQLRRIAEAMGDSIDEDLILEHQQFCEELEEHMFLREAGEIVKIVAAAIILLLVNGAYELQMKNSCRMLLTLVLNRCVNEDQAFAEDVRKGFAEILASHLVPTLVVLHTAPSSGSQH